MSGRWCFYCGASEDDAELKVVEGIPRYSPYDACADFDACMKRMETPRRYP